MYRIIYTRDLQKRTLDSNHGLGFEFVSSYWLKKEPIRAITLDTQPIRSLVDGSGTSMVVRKRARAAVSLAFLPAILSHRCINKKE